jgi:hypothetical protein
MIAIIEGLCFIGIALVVIFAIVKFVQNCAGDENAD